MFKIKRFLSVSAVFVVVASFIFTYNRLTEGFGLRQIQSSLSNDPSKEIHPLSESEKEFLRKIFSQPFYYLGKGAQSYAFESEDGNYVVKFFKHKHLRPLTWLNNLPIPSIFRPYCTKKIEKRNRRIRNLFTSYKLAFEEMKEETGLIYIHLNREPDLLKTITIFDKIGFKHTILIDNYEYTLQKKGIQVLDALPVDSSFSEEEFRSKLQQLCHVIILRCEKGIKDKDPAILRNMAFSKEEPRAIYIDTGAFCKDLAITSKKEIYKDVLLRLDELRSWSKKHNPQLIPIIDDIAQGYDSNGSNCE